MSDDFIWCEKYRPDTIDRCILPDNTRSICQGIIRDQDMQSLLFYAGSGIGKTTVARAICNELKIEYMFVNGSKEGRLIETVRGPVMQFASSMSVLNSSKLKVIIYDEFDNSGDVQMAIRGVMEEVSRYCRFIFTGNYVNRIIEPIQSRCALIDFSIPKSEKKSIMAKMLTRCIEILDIEGVKYNKGVLARLIVKNFPDFRKIINELQLYSLSGDIDEGILEIKSKHELLIDNIISKDFGKCLEWINSNNFDVNIYSSILKECESKVKPQTWIALNLLVNTYILQHLQTVDPMINLRAFCINMMEIC